MNTKLITIVILVATLAVAGTAMVSFQRGQSLSNIAQSAPHLSVSPKEHDFGKILQSGGAVSADFRVTNDGGKDALVSEVLASCSCTTAEIEKKTIRPGETVNLKVVFDPNYHFEDEGRFFRTATIKYNGDGYLPEAKIYVEVDYDLGKDKLKFPPRAEEEEHKD